MLENWWVKLCLSQNPLWFGNEGFDPLHFLLFLLLFLRAQRSIILHIQVALWDQNFVRSYQLQKTQRT